MRVPSHKWVIRRSITYRGYSAPINSCSLHGSFMHSLVLMNREKLIHYFWNIISEWKEAHLAFTFHITPKFL
jgi:hypothetical protein